MVRISSRRHTVRGRSSRARLRRRGGSRPSPWGLWLLVLAAAAGAHLVKVVRTLRWRRGARPVERVSA